MQSPSLPPLPFPAQPPPTHETAVPLSPRILCITAANPSPYTFHGTNTFLVLSSSSALVIDPGPSPLLAPAHLDTITRTLKEMHKTLAFILLTHAHADHVGLAADLKRLNPSARVVGCPADSSEKKVEDDEAVDSSCAVEVAVYDRCSLQMDEVEVVCVPTPGHVRNHVAYVLVQENACFTGDHVLSFATTVVSDVAAYLRSLEALLGMRDPLAALYPAHGCAVVGVDKVRELLEALFAHRTAREAQLSACLKEGVRSLDAIVQRLYADKPVALHPLAKRSLHAHLVKLVNDGQADPALLDENQL